ncbi:HTH-type transcriptional regulator QacR [Posidoniimonas polymericola]|uniref:HTH-type transcriptional regulator QacR n=1 Tax=Posidoniimonas polymericola TaxID=2528002 RepID=A0A5C5YSU3_9BACT|nr:TetR/AcrR family transcriptional regulator [Posidoniimonas polymericola]TWT77988.1 HTH-type transcriptional regulator QacR [Posidoniimonas polymericola]
MGIGTRDRIVAAGRELFAKHGFGQVGLDQIVQQARLTKTTFYNHFESKEQLIREVLDLQEHQMREAVSAAVEQQAAGDPRRKLVAMFRVLPEILDGGCFGCNLLISAAADYPNELDPIHQAVSRNKQAMSKLVQGWAEEAGAADAAALAGMLVQIYYGSVLDQMLSNDREQSFANAFRAAELCVGSAFA